jgi:hypothetical protein
VTINGERVVGIAGNRDESHSVFQTLDDVDFGERNGGTACIASPSIDQSSIRGGNQTSGRRRCVIP